MLERNKALEQIRFILRRLREIKFDAFDVYKQGSKRNLDLLREIKTGTKGIKLTAFLKLLKNIVPKRFLSEWNRVQEIEFGEDVYIYSGEYYKRGSENLVYVLKCRDKDGQDFVLKFKFETMATQFTFDELEEIARLKTLEIEIVEEIFEGCNDVIVAAKRYFMAPNPINQVQSLAHIMNFVSFDPGSKVFDPFYNFTTDDLRVLIEVDRRWLKVFKEFIYRLENEAFARGQFLDLIGHDGGNVLCGYINGEPKIVLVDVDTCNNDQKWMASQHGLYMNLKVFLENNYQLKIAAE